MALSPVLETVFWLIVVWDAIWIPLTTYHFYIYWKYRHNPFISNRFPKATLYLIIINILIVVHRFINALIGLCYIPQIWEISVPFTFTQFFPFFTLVVYKLC